MYMYMYMICSDSFEFGVKSYVIIIFTPHMYLAIETHPTVNGFHCVMPTYITLYVRTSTGMNMQLDSSGTSMSTSFSPMTYRALLCHVLSFSGRASTTIQSLGPVGMEEKLPGERVVFTLVLPLRLRGCGCWLRSSMASKWSQVTSMGSWSGWVGSGLLGSSLGVLHLGDLFSKSSINTCKSHANCVSIHSMNTDTKYNRFDTISYTYIMISKLEDTCNIQYVIYLYMYK